MLGLEEIIGLELISSDARVIGTIEGVGMDLAAWKIKALKVGLRRGMTILLPSMVGSPPFSGTETWILPEASGRMLIAMMAAITK